MLLYNLANDTLMTTFQMKTKKKIKSLIKFPFKRKACQVYRVGYGRGRIW